MGQGQADPILSIRGLRKQFRVGMWRRKVDAVRDVSLDVYPGEIFGFLGPNGAGKTTTIKSLMGLVRPTAGQISLFGQPHDALDVRRRIGFLPEHPYFYDYLTPEETLDFFGRLYGLSKTTRRERIDTLLERLGLSHVRQRNLRKFSKGMVQRVGLAQALLAEPALVVLDEPMSGLDPVGRKEVRDIMVQLRAEGRTVFFSSHILSDIESICDRVAIVDQGRLVQMGTLDSLLAEGERIVDIEAANVGPELAARLEVGGAKVQDLGGKVLISQPGSGHHALALLVAGGARVVSLQPRRESLEDLFMRKAIESSRPQETA